MNISDLIAQDRVWLAISECLCTRRTKPTTTTGWINFSCPLCSDTRDRCGVRNMGSESEVNCFNCKFYTKYSIGSHLGAKMIDFMVAFGVSRKQVAHVALWAARVRRQMADDPGAQQALDRLIMPKYPAIELPKRAQSLQDWADQGCVDRHFCAAVEYLYSRGHVAANATTYFWTPETRANLHRRLIIPCYQDDRLVGWTARSVDHLQPRYIKELPPNYLFNTAFLTGPRQYVLIVEGAFDALVIDAVAALGGTLNERQIAHINQCGKRVVVVPDRDRAGAHLIETAIQQHWAVAAPHVGRHQWWGASIKDADDAVRLLGKLYVMKSILATQETDPGKIRQSAKYYLK
jgi:hypothetical protein